ncbi:hypothetical protein GCM10011390_45850 [Aureimonas endophytica]|uniref:Uncharacterized protein n=2 Tax=Aureimonas endophytica TaxID=2027858 RepID=A0A917EDD1_9HYPH|nr:ethanolamine ammonia-lyase subunit EutB [Aureimonas endophytica]GGE21355.1 hypothetical protein GCM10011390_45850 [Aureimonas endophytica]
MAKASPACSGDVLARLAGDTAVERTMTRFCLADLPLRMFLSAALIPRESDEITRLILDTMAKPPLRRSAA